MSNRAALYLRSSKDRSDVSIAAQRRKLTALAGEHRLEVVAEFTDVVESAKTEHRPGFQQMIANLARRDREWGTLLMLDTSRLARRVHIAHWFVHEARRRHGVKVMFANVPETDQITRVILESNFHAFDEVHSLMSREKGLAGQRENVHRGFRAGGRAPWGYRLEHVDTGAVRNGEPVRKSRLVGTDELPVVGRYLQQRAAGLPRRPIMRELGIDKAQSTMVGVEWNALTYAGHTVWNVCVPRENGHCIGGKKRRPRGEWVIERDTHEAVITDQQAERILDRLENSTTGQAVSAAKRGASAYLLTGLLDAPDGRQWTGHRHVRFNQPRYRLRRQGDLPGRTVAAADVDRVVVDQVIADMGSGKFARVLLRETQKSYDREGGDPAGELRQELVHLTGQIDKAMELSLQLETPGPALRKVDELERRRRSVAEEIHRLEAEQRQNAALAHVTPQQVQRLMRERLEALTEAEPARLKAVLGALVERITLDPSDMSLEIHYRLEAGGWLSMATPRVAAGWPPLRAVRCVQVA